MDAVPIKVGMVRLDLGGAKRRHPVQMPDPRLLQLWDVGGEALSRRAEARRVQLLRNPEDLDRVAQAAGHGLVDKDRLVEGEYPAGLPQVRSAVEA
jgi:hypothetical protein